MNVFRKVIGTGTGVQEPRETLGNNRAVKEGTYEEFFVLYYKKRHFSNNYIMAKGRYQWPEGRTQRRLSDPVGS